MKEKRFQKADKIEFTGLFLCCKRNNENTNLMCLLSLADNKQRRNEGKYDWLDYLLPGQRGLQ